MSSSSFVRAALGAGLFTTLAAGCSGSGAPDPRARDPYMRPAETGASSALYFTLRNPGADTLVLTGAEIDVATSSSIHQSMEHDGMSTMHPIDSLVLPPNDSLVFSERGLHVMATDLHAALHVGDTVVVRLRYRGARVDTLRVLVRE